MISNYKMNNGRVPRIHSKVIFLNISTKQSNDRGYKHMVSSNNIKPYQGGVSSS